MLQAQPSDTDFSALYRSLTDARAALEETVEAPDFLRRLRGIRSDAAASPHDSLRALLRLGAEHFGVDHGHLARVDLVDGAQTIVAAGGPAPLHSRGETLDLPSTYGRVLVAGREALAVHNAAEEGWAEDPAPETIGGAAYLGTKVVVDGELYGTIGFVDRAPRERAFDEGDAAALALLARAARRALRPRHADPPEPTRPQLEALFERSPNMINLHDLDGNILSPNPRLCEETGYEAEELTDMKVWDLDRDAVPETAREIWAGMGPGERLRWEGRYRRKDGSTFPVEVDLRRLDIAGSARFAVTSRDISERTEAREALRRSEELHRTTLSNITDAVLIAADDGTLTYVCPNVGHIFGCDRQEAERLGTISALLGHDPAADHDFDGTEELTNVEQRVTDAEGTPHDLLINIRPVSIQDGTRMYTCRDITDRKAAERELARQNMLFSIAQDLAHVGGWEYDVQNDESTLTEETCRIFGLPPETALSLEEGLSYYHPDDRPAVQSALRRAIEEGEPYDLELRLIDADGTRRWVHTRGVPQIRDGETVRVRGSLQDITDRKEAEATAVDRQEKIRALYETTSRLPRAQRPEEVVDHLHDLLRDLFDYPVTAVNLRRGDELVPERTFLEEQDELPDAQPLSVEDDSVAARAYRGGAPVVIDDVRTLDNDVDYGPLRAAAGLPIEEHGAVVVARVEDDGFDPFLLRLVDILTTHAATVLDRLEREHVLREERNLLDRILETSPAAIAVLNAEGEFMQVSGRAEDILGLDREAVADRTYDDPEWRVRTPDGRPMPEEELPFHRVTTTGAPVQDLEHTIEWPDGTQKLLSVSGAPLRDADGSLEGAVFHLDDITEQRAAERELRSTKRLLEKTFESLNEVVLVVDPTTRQIIACNSAVEDMFGYDRDELIGRNTECLHTSPEAYEHFGAVSEPSLEAEGLFRHDYQMQRKDGRVIETEHVVTPLEGDDWPDGVVSVIRDVTERRRAEEHLREREEQLRGLANSVPGVVFQFFARPDGTRGNYFISEHVESVLGIEGTLNDFFEQFVRRIPSSHREAFLASVDRAVEDARPWHFETPFRKPSGERIWLLGTSTPTRRDGELIFNGVLLDITDRREAEQALREERDRFATLFHNLPTPVVHGHPGDEGRIRIQSVNEPFEQVFGYAEDDVQGEDIQALIVPEDQQADAEDIRRRLLSGEPARREVRRETADGLRDFRVQVALREGEAAPLEGYAIYTDITERKERERTLAHRTALLEAQTEATLDGLLAVDDDRRVVFHNEQFLDLWALPPSLVARDSTEGPRGPALHDAMSDRVSNPEAFRSVVEHLHAHPDEERRDLLRLTDGRWLDRYSAPIVGDENAHFGRLWVFRDVTARRRMQERLLEVQEEERRRIDQEIHDEMGGLLTSLQFSIGLARRQAQTPDVGEHFDQLEELVSELSTVARTISRKLYPSALSEHGLAGTLPSLADEIENQYDLAVDLRCEVASGDRFSSLLERTAYWIVQEALVNAGRHAETGTAHVTVREDEHRLCLRVSDEGVGFDPSRQEGDKSFGIEGIRRRVERLNGTVEIDTAPGQGTRIVATLPLTVASGGR